MKYLLDTHTLIWFMDGDNSLPTDIVALIKNEDNECFLSVASLWEIAIKFSIGKLELQFDLNEITKFIHKNKIEQLPIELSHLQNILTLEHFHRDPFDRLIIAQAMAEDLTIITTDKNFKHYPVKCVW